ncbi:helix-turn-helix domain-containing protein [Micromonospora endophytica]|uniref:DNA-binding protein n=1 Tax=Micromonospora endophytica TaxID=515350 RepID=A0A2W2CQA4_9ACTN|nr:helix-turn-helix transcriptional regulator [Micromonospora endophytica]PZF95394.1 DNA-binding protein [Micromonospora endophytica]RIW50911.1 XRE family transcriptional regulator [Micromonospora endophytica]BCJ60562.1 transcriptional regulator [Micromonospora endophytica]
MEGSTADLIRAQLRRLRVAAGLSQEEFGKLVHYSASMVSAVETGSRPYDRSFLTRADEVLDSGGLLVALLRIAEREGQPSWFLPWLDAERLAQQLRVFQPSLIPALLQTEGYARAVIRCDDLLSDEEVERRTAARLDRQAILDQPEPPQLIAVIDESVLHRRDERFWPVMVHQIEQMIACAERPNVSVHVIPLSVGLHIGLSGPFSLARGVDGGWVAIMENQLTASPTDGEADLATLSARWETVRNEALSRQQSIQLLKKAAKSWT